MGGTIRILLWHFGQCKETGKENRQTKQNIFKNFKNLSLEDRAKASFFVCASYVDAGVFCAWVGVCVCEWLALFFVLLVCAGVQCGGAPQSARGQYS